jgi:hypothetical protein
MDLLSAPKYPLQDIAKILIIVLIILGLALFLNSFDWESFFKTLDSYWLIDMQ